MTSILFVTLPALGDSLINTAAVRWLHDSVSNDIDVYATSSKAFEVFQENKRIKTLHDSIPSKKYDYIISPRRWPFMRRMSGLHLISPPLNHSIHIVLSETAFLGKIFNKTAITDLSYEFEFDRSGVSDSNTVGLNVGRSTLGTSKDLTLEQYKAIATEFLRHGVSLILFGDKHVSEFAEKIPCTTNMVGKTTLKEAAAKINSCGAFVSVDTGLLHLATLTDTRIIALYGKSTPFSYKVDATTLGLQSEPEEIVRKAMFPT